MSNKGMGKIKSPLDTVRKGGEKMIESLVRPESWITEVLRISSPVGEINKLEFGHLLLYAMPHIDEKIKKYKRGGIDA